MRVHLKTATQVCILLFVLCSVFISFRRTQRTNHTDFDWWMRNISFDGRSDRTTACLTASAYLLAGEIPHLTKYLTLGLSSVKRNKESYLLETLHSIFVQSSEAELADLVVVVLLADFDLQWVHQTLQSIVEHFPKQLIQSQLLVIHANKTFYPRLTDLKRNFNDPQDRVAFRSKQNVDYAFLVDFSAGLSEYYIMLEDDIRCSRGFLTSIRNHLSSLMSSTWVTLEFSKLGYIGKLYHSTDLPRLAQFLFLFYQEMPCDFLLSHFRKLHTQDKVIRFRPSLFQHMGTFSSFRGTYNRLKDEDFEADPADNPAATIYTNIIPYKQYHPENAYNQGENYFWGQSPIKAGKYFLVVFHKPESLCRVLINTGKNGQDVLKSADVELGESVVQTGGRVQCTGTHALGSLTQGHLERIQIQDMLKNSVMCLRITVTADQESWLIIQNIQVWTNKQA